MPKSCYIHIPFCSDICTYCDFSKMYYQSELVDNYLEVLKREIEETYDDKRLETLYIGGGTPSCLNNKQLEKLLKTTKIFKLNKDYEFTFECNIENTTIDKLVLLKKYGVNRLSFGIQTFNGNYIKYLNRKHNKESVFAIIEEAKKLGFNNINVDLMYGFKNQTLEDVKEDLNMFIKLPITHISTYSLIIEEKTKLYINGEENIDEDLEYSMYDYICSTLCKYGYDHYEISNFTKEGYKSRHNLTYWHNEYYYGFGLGASGYINNIRYDNTKSITNYLKGKYRLEENKLSKQITMENELILGLRLLEGISLDTFYQKYNCYLEEVFNIKKLQHDNLVKVENNRIFIPENNLYISNIILETFIGEKDE